MFSQMAGFGSFLWPGSIPLCVYVCDDLLIHSSIHRHFGCFHILAIVNSATVNIGVHMSFQISVFVLFE